MPSVRKNPRSPASKPRRRPSRKPRKPTPRPATAGGPTGASDPPDADPTPADELSNLAAELAAEEPEPELVEAEPVERTAPTADELRTWGTVADLLLRAVWGTVAISTKDRRWIPTAEELEPQRDAGALVLCKYVPASLTAYGPELALATAVLGFVATRGEPVVDAPDQRESASNGSPETPPPAPPFREPPRRPGDGWDDLGL